MKIPIHIEEDLLWVADEAAQSMGMSRSLLLALAVRDFLRQRRGEQMLRGLNAVYEGKPDPSEKHLLNFIKGKVRPVAMDRW